jgi:hypothetical protein
VPPSRAEVRHGWVGCSSSRQSQGRRDSREPWSRPPRSRPTGSRFQVRPSRGAVGRAHGRSHRAWRWGSGTGEAGLAVGGRSRTRGTEGWLGIRVWPGGGGSRCGEARLVRGRGLVRGGEGRCGEARLVREGESWCGEARLVRGGGSLCGEARAHAGARAGPGLAGRPGSRRVELTSGGGGRWLGR